MHPLAFALTVLRNFQAHQGLLLAGAIAYNALLSLLPLLILSVILLSDLVAPSELLGTLERYLEWLVPSQSAAVLEEQGRFLEKKVAIGSFLLATIVFFSSLTFSALNQAMAVIFARRPQAGQRSSLLSLLLPYAFVVVLGLGLLAVTLVSVAIQALLPERIELLGSVWHLRGLSGAILYLIGLATEALLIAAIYHFLPVGRIAVRLCAGRRPGRGAALGDHPPPADLVLHHAIDRQRGLWLAGQHGGHPAQPGNRRHHAARRRGDRRIRATGTSCRRLTHSGSADGLAVAGQGDTGHR